MTIMTMTKSGRAVAALHSILGGGEVDGLHCGPRMYGYRFAKSALILIAGDTDDLLDHAALEPMAAAKGCDVLATWVDQFKSGHRFLIDAVLLRDGETRHFARMRLCRLEGRRDLLVPEDGEGACVRFQVGGLREVERPRWLTKPRRLVGVARGQADLQAAIQTGPAQDRWLSY